MHFRRLRVLLLTTVLASSTPWAAAPPPPAVAQTAQMMVKDPPDTLVLSPCVLPGLAQPARCGVLQVPEAPDQPTGRQLPIHVAVIPATGQHPRPDPIVLLSGGPGEESISAAQEYADLFAGLRDDREILLVDQRGTGLSGALVCQLYAAEKAATLLHDLFPPDAVRKCAKELSARADLTQYTYLHFAGDLERVRRALRYGPLNLFALSYGTRAAQVYIRAYPGSVRTVYLGSVVPIDIAMPLPFARAAQSALEKTFAACAADPPCQAAFPKLREEFSQILTRLDAGAVRARAPDSSVRVPLTRGRIAERLRAMLYKPESAASVPWTIHQAHLNDWGPFADGIVSAARENDKNYSYGLFFSITCNEDVAFLREQDFVPQTRDTFLGMYRVRQQRTACRYWPHAKLAADYRKPIATSVPTMFVSGDSDPATPLWLTAHVAPGFAHRQEIILHGQAHSGWSECVSSLYQQLVRRGAVEGPANPSCEPTPRPPFKTPTTTATPTANAIGN